MSTAMVIAGRSVHLKNMYVEDSVDKKLDVTKALALKIGIYKFW